jgi:hypothetical protein
MAPTKRLDATGASPAQIDSGLGGVRLVMTRWARPLQRANGRHLSILPD